MSLRPSFAAFSLDKLKSLFGSKDMAAKQFALECYAKFAYDDREIKQAEKILQKIIMGEFQNDPPEIEDEIFQISQFIRFRS